MTTTYISTLLDRFFNNGYFDSDWITGLSYPQKPHNVYLYDNGDLLFEVAAQDVNKDEINVKSKNQNLIIDIERNDKNDDDKNLIIGKLSKSDIHLEYPLNDKYDMTKVKVSLSKGLLKVTVPVKEEKRDTNIDYKID